MSLVPGSIAFLAMLLWPAAAYSADAAGLFQIVIGEVRVIGADRLERMATKGDKLHEGDRVVTAEGALAQVRFADGGLMSIRANSEFVLDKFSYTGPDDDKPGIVMSLVKGGLRSITGLIGKKNRDGYRINTTTSTIGIRGTDHEPMVILPPPPGGKAVDLPGTYDKVNEGSTYLRTPKGVVEILPRQVGFVPGADMAPRLLPKVPDFYRGDPPRQGAVGPAGKPGERSAEKSGDARPDPRSGGRVTGPGPAMDKPGATPPPPAAFQGPAMTSNLPPPSMIQSPATITNLPPPPLLQSPTTATNLPPPPVIQSPTMTTTSPPPPTLSPLAPPPLLAPIKK